MKKILSFAGAALLSLGILACAEEPSSNENDSHLTEEVKPQTIDEACKSIEDVLVETEQALFALTSVASNAADRYVPGLDEEEERDYIDKNEPSESDVDEQLEEFFTDPQANFEIYLKSAEPEVILNTWDQLSISLNSNRNVPSHPEVQSSLVNLLNKTINVYDSIENAYSSPGSYDTKIATEGLKEFIDTMQTLEGVCY